MDALFVVVAELLLVPLVLWVLIVLDLTLGVVTSIVSYLLGRRTAGQALTHGLGALRRRLLWSVVFLGVGLVLVDLLLFDPIVSMVLAEVDEREGLEIGHGEAHGSFILGRIELDELSVVDVRGGADPSARFEVRVESLVIDIDTLALLTARFAVEDIALEGVRGSVDRLAAAEATNEDRGPGFELAREFTVERVHFGAVELDLRDHTKPALDGSEGPRTFALILDELDIGPLHSHSAIFDLLYSVRGRGSLEGVEFGLRSSAGPPPTTTLEVEALPLSLLADAIAERSGLAVEGSASLELTSVYREDPPEPRVELQVALLLRELDLDLADNAGLKARLALKLAGKGLEALGGNVPVEAQITVPRTKLEGVRTLAESGVIEEVGRALVSSLRQTLREAPNY